MTAAATTTRICSICQERERLPFVECSWSCIPQKCHNAHLACLVRYIAQTGHAADLADRHQSVYSLTVGRCFYCRAGCRRSKFIDRRTTGWFKRFEFYADSRDTYVGLAEQHIANGLPYDEECPGCGVHFNIPGRFYEHVQICDDGQMIKLPCNLCGSTFQYENDLKMAFEKHRNSGSCVMAKCQKVKKIRFVQMVY